MKQLLLVKFSPKEQKLQKSCKFQSQILGLHPMPCLYPLSLKVSEKLSFCGFLINISPFLQFFVLLDQNCNCFLLFYNMLWFIPWYMIKQFQHKMMWLLDTERKKKQLFETAFCIIHMHIRCSEFIEIR